MTRFAVCALVAAALPASLALACSSSTSPAPPTWGASDGAPGDAIGDASGSATGDGQDGPRTASDGAADARRDSSKADGPHSSLDALQPMDPCNGNPASCDQTYDAVAYPTAHAAMAYAFPPFPCPAQQVPVRTQLDQGIRALDLEVHPSVDLGDGGSPLALCLESCAAGELPIDVALDDVAAFLAVNPREVVTLLIGGGADAGELASAIAAAKLDAFTLSHAISDPWPTLASLITSGKRVVVLADVTGTAPLWMLPLWSFVRETGRDFTSPASMTCDITRGSATAPLFLLNEFLVDGEGGTPAGTDAGPDASADAGGRLAPGCDDPALARVVNADPFFMNRVTACVQQRGVKPTFLSVDDFGVGDLSGVLSSLNPYP